MAYLLKGYFGIHRRRETRGDLLYIWIYNFDVVVTGKRSMRVPGGAFQGSAEGVVEI